MNPKLPVSYIEFLEMIDPLHPRLAVLRACLLLTERHNPPPLYVPRVNLSKRNHHEPQAPRL